MTQTQWVITRASLMTKLFITGHIIEKIGEH